MISAHYLKLLIEPGVFRKFIFMYMHLFFCEIFMNSKNNNSVILIIRKYFRSPIPGALPVVKLCRLRSWLLVNIQNELSMFTTKHL